MKKQIFQATISFTIRQIFVYAYIHTFIHNYLYFSAFLLSYAKFYVTDIVSIYYARLSLYILLIGKYDTRTNTLNVPLTHTLIELVILVLKTFLSYFS